MPTRVTQPLRNTVPFNLDGLFAAGTIVLDSPNVPESGNSHGDGHDTTPWALVAHDNTDWLLDAPTTSEPRLALSYLIYHLFVVATFQHRHGRLWLRLYMVPYDLPGVVPDIYRRGHQGEVMQNGKKYLRALLGIATRSMSAWNADAGYVSGKPEDEFFYEKTVCYLATSIEATSR
jgi:hypothetical protein